MEYFVTIAAAILGSGVLTTGIGLIAAKYGATRQAETLEAWTTERQLLRQLEDQAGIVDDGANTSARDLALAVAARTQVNAAIASRLIPKNNVSNTITYLSGIFLVILGPLAIIAGVVFAFSSPDAEMRFLAAASALLGLGFSLLAILLIFVGYNSEAYRNIMRAQVQRILNNDPPSDRAYPKGKPWSAGQEPEFSKRHRIALSPDVRQSFSYFMKNATRSTGHNTTSTPQLAP